MAEDKPEGEEMEEGAEVAEAQVPSEGDVWLRRRMDEMKKEKLEAKKQAQRDAQKRREEEKRQAAERKAREESEKKEHEMEATISSRVRQGVAAVIEARRTQVSGQPMGRFQGSARPIFVCYAPEADGNERLFVYRFVRELQRRWPRPRPIGRGKNTASSSTGEIYLYNSATGERRWQDEAGDDAGAITTTQQPANTSRMGDMWGPADDGVQWTNNAALDGASFAPLAMSPPFRPAPRMLPAPQRPIYVTQPSPSPVRMVQGPPPQVVVQQPPQQQQAPPGLWDEDSIIRACLMCTYRTCVFSFLLVILILVVLNYEKIH